MSPRPYHRSIILLSLRRTQMILRSITLQSLCRTLMILSSNLLFHPIDHHLALVRQIYHLLMDHIWDLIRVLMDPTFLTDPIFLTHLTHLTPNTNMLNFQRSHFSLVSSNRQIQIYRLTHNLSRRYTHNLSQSLTQ